MKRTPIKRKSRLSPVSAKRRGANKEYAASRKAFLALRPLCEVWRQIAQDQDAELFHAIFKTGVYSHPVYSEDIHHVEGRAGSRFLDVNTWMAVSRKAHRWIHSHGRQAREKGWLK